MLIDLGQYASLFQGLCYLNLYIGFQLDFNCGLQVPTKGTNLCSLVRIQPIFLNAKQLPFDGTIIQNRSQKQHLYITHYCRKRTRRSVRHMVIPDQHVIVNSLVRSEAFGNPSLPGKPPRKRRRKPPRKGGK